MHVPWRLLLSTHLACLAAETITPSAEGGDDGTCQHCQMVWVRLARRKGATRVNQRLNAPQEKTTSSNLADQGWVVTRTRRCRGTLELVDVAGSEAVVNACGVAAARSQGHSWTPIPLKGSRMNVGTSAPRGVWRSCRDERTRPSVRRSAPVEAEGSPTRGAPQRVGAALTTPGRVSTVR